MTLRGKRAPTSVTLSWCTRNWVNSKVRAATSAAWRCSGEPGGKSSGKWWRTMSTHDPEGETMKPSVRPKTSSHFTARSRAWVR